MRHFNKWKVAILLVGLAVLIAAGFLVVWLIKTYGAIGGLVLVPLAGAGAALNETAKAVGAKPMQKSESGKPRRPGPSGHSPKPEEGKKRARPRINRGRYR